MEISEIKQIGKSENYRVFLCGNYALTLSLETIVKNKIKVGQEISQKELENLQFEGDKTLALDKCVALLSKTIKTKKEILDYLKQKGFLNETIEFVCEKLTEYRLIDDKTYAERYVESLKSFKGKRYIENMLKLKGVENSIIKNVLADLKQSDEVLNLAKKYFKNNEKNEKNKQKLYRFLLSRGFSFDECKRAVEIIFKGDENDWN